MSHAYQNRSVWYNTNNLTRSTAVLLAATLYAGAVLAMNDTSDPMGSGICYFVAMLTGKWIFGLSVIAFIACMLSFMSGVEMNEFMKKLASTFMVITGLLAGVNIIKAFASFMGVAASC